LVTVWHRAGNFKLAISSLQFQACHFKRAATNNASRYIAWQHSIAPAEMQSLAEPMQTGKSLLAET
jgi:hypothetical protein